MQKFIYKNLYNRSFLSYILYPLSLIYSLIAILRRKFHSSGFSSRCKVISIGNIISGGSGKTPVTIFLAKHFRDSGKKVAVSHRGYKGKFEYENRLISDHKKIYNIAKDAGDEAFLLATKLKGIPVIAGKDRKLSIKILEKRFPDLEIILLDDSFQNFKVEHELDFVVFNQFGGIGNGFVLPAGILREPLSALKDCDYIIYNGKGDIPEKIQRFEKTVIRGNYIVTRIYDKNENPLSLDELRNSRNALLSGIGQPESFEKTVKATGIEFERHFAFPDHYDYADSTELTKLEAYDNVITTEKDYAKLRYIENKVNLIVVEIEFNISGEFDLLK